MNNFADLVYHRRADLKSNLILMLDTDFSKLPAWLQQGKLTEFGRNWAAVSEAVTVYDKYFIETTAEHIAAVMPRLSSYMQYGAYGIRALEWNILNALRCGVPVILDTRTAEYFPKQQLPGNAFIGRVPGWEGLQPANMHAHAMSIIPHYGHQMIEAYLEMSRVNKRGLVIVPDRNIDWTALAADAEKLRGFTVAPSGLAVFLEDHQISMLENLVGNRLTALIQNSEIFDAFQLQAMWQSQAPDVRNRTFVCVGSEINDGNDRQNSDFDRTDDEALRAYFNNRLERLLFYKKIFA